MSQAKKKQMAGQLKAIKEHEAKRAAYPDPRDKATAQRRSTTRPTASTSCAASRSGGTVRPGRTGPPGPDRIA